MISIGARASLIAELGRETPWALALVGCVARAGPVWLLSALPYVTADDAAKSRDIARAGTPQALVAMAWAGAAVGGASLAGLLTAPRVGPCF